MRHFIIIDEVPAWFDIFTLKNDTHLGIAIHEKAHQFVLEMIKPDAPIVCGLGTKFNLPDFIPPQPEGWGFGKLLKQITLSAMPNRMVYVVKLPRIFKLSRTDKEPRPDWKSAYAISATLNILFMVLNLFEEKVDSEKKQLVMPNLVTDTGLHGGSLEVELSKNFTDWIAKQIDNDTCKYLVHTLMNSYKHMYAKHAHHSVLSECSAYFDKPDRVIINCPGDACGLYPEHSRIDGWGYSLECHNVDGPGQQLTLLMGVAKMHMLARQDGY